MRLPRRRLRRLFVAAIVATACGVTSGGSLLSASGNSDSPAASAAASSPAPVSSLIVGGDVPTPVTLGRDALEKLPRAESHVKDRDGKDVVFAGTPLADILRAAGVKFDAAMPSRSAVASYVLVEAQDGYRAVFALAEADPSQTDRVILLADSKDGAPLSPAEGPWRIVVPGEKRPARWVRQVTAISVHKG
jgi:DMSO/TMAO reductase YedYZ molybdopterin-dependent catalytic subunit